MYLYQIAETFYLVETWPINGEYLEMIYRGFIWIILEFAQTYCADLRALSKILKE